MRPDGSSAGTPASRLGIVVALVLAFALALGFYAWNAAPTVLYGDSAEIQAVGLVGGVAHGSGYPGFILTGQVFGRLGWPDHAYRITFMSAFFGAATVALLVHVLVGMGLSTPTAFAGALSFAAGYTFLEAALRAEVYTHAAFLSLLALWATLRALRRGRARDLLLAGFLLGISLTGHLAYALPVAALGLALAWRVVTTHRIRSFSMLLGLLGVFLLGLTPYLYLVWADARRMPMDCLASMDQCLNPLGGYDPTFHDPWQRVWQFLRGTGPCPPHAANLDPHTLLRMFYWSGIIVSVFELGPVGSLLAVVGFVRELRRHTSRALLLALLATLSMAFTAAMAPSDILDLMLIPCLLYLGIFVAAGMESVAIGLARGRIGSLATRVALCLLAPALVIVPAHAVRHWLHDHPIPRLSLRIEAEDYLISPSFLPSLRQFDEPRRFGEKALAMSPRGALILAGWWELENLRYFQIVEGRRPDVLLWPDYYPNVLLKIGRWQQEHTLQERPIVLASHSPALAAHFTAVDSVEIVPGRTLYVARSPLRDLDRP